MLQRTFFSLAILTLITTAPNAPAKSRKATVSFSLAKACTSAQGQIYIDQAQYRDAIREFTCVINDQPTEVEGYRGRIEAELLSGRYSDAVRDYARVTALVEPVHPDAESIILASYSSRLAIDENNVAALTGASFAHWWYFDYPGAIHVLNQLLSVRPNDTYGNLFRGSSRVLSGSSRANGALDLERAIALEPQSPDVHYIVADAYTYGSLPDPNRAFAEATLALNGGLDTPRVHAILAAAYNNFGNLIAAATEIERHIDLVTTQLITTTVISSRTSLNLNLAPGRTYDIPLPVVAGQTVAISTSSRDFYDTILVLLAPDGSPVLGADDTNKYFAAFEWKAATTGTYRVLVTSFEAVNTGQLTITRN
jgi:tetratricopeptide (TPR) repeat protein